MAVNEASCHRAGMCAIRLADVAFGGGASVIAVESADSSSVLCAVGESVNYQMLPVLREHDRAGDVALYGVLVADCRDARDGSDAHAEVVVADVAGVDARMPLTWMDGRGWAYHLLAVPGGLGGNSREQTLFLLDS